MSEASDPPPGHAALDEYRQLRDEKAADWRLITQTTVATLATSAAVVGAGLAVHSRVLVVLAPLPFYLGVAYMIQSAWLQTRLIAFLAASAPRDSLNYELRVLVARQDAEVQRRTPRWAVSWQWWRAVAAALGLLLSLFPFLVRLENLQGFEKACPGWYTLGGLALLLAFVLFTGHLARNVASGSQFWRDYWSLKGVDSASVSHEPIPPDT